MGKTSIAYIVNSAKASGGVTATIKAAAVKRAVAESCRKLSEKKICKANRRRKFGVTEVAQYLKGHPGLNIEPSWIPRQRTLEKRLANVNPALRRRTQRVAKLKNTGNDPQQEYSIEVMSRTF